MNSARRLDGADVCPSLRDGSCVCVFTGTFSAGWLLLHVRVWTEASHQWLFTHCQGVVESMLHICSHLAPRSDKNNVLHREGLHAKLLYGFICWSIYSEWGTIPAIHVDPLSFWVLHHLAAFWAPLRHSLMTAVNLSHMFSIGRLGLKVKAG